MSFQKPEKGNSLKKFLLAVLLIIIAFIAIKKYLYYNKVKDISRFEYLPSKNTDVNYFDKTALAEYNNNCIELSNKARTLWMEHDLDVTKPEEVKEAAKPLFDEYKSLLTYTKTLEEKLKESKDLKEEGFSNTEVSEIISNGLTIGAYMNMKEARMAYKFLQGKNVRKGSPSNEVWELQKLLNNNEYNIPIDGVFSLITDSALSNFQSKNNLFVSHSCDDLTLQKLVE